MASYSCFSILTRRSRGRAHDSQPLAQRQLATDIVTVAAEGDCTSAQAGMLKLHDTMWISVA